MNVQKLLCLCIAVFCFLSTQAIERNCGTMDYLQKQIEEDSKRANKMAQIEAFTNNYIDNLQSAQQRSAVITIPVVVHVVYNGNTENISDAQIQSQITVLNDDFRRNNSDANGTWSQAADTEIQFCMASVDPNGNATNGITRTSTSVSAFGTNDNMKFNSSGGKDAWPAGDYLNMWVCDISGGILGYAQFPGGAPATDGVVMDYQYFGTIGTASAPFDLGRTATHEVGHWLNLRHIWGDGNCNADDFVTDTPTSDAANYGCATGHVSCSSTDMVQNYMDYSDDACMNLFTQGQKTRMQATLAGTRSSLQNSNGCGSSGPNPTCNDGIQNQGETGVDCGGPCAACPCNGTQVTVSITLDNYPEETTWSITNSNGSTVASGGTYANQPDGSTVNISACLSNGCYTFTINDAYGDGICCSYGSGSYTVFGGGSTLASGGSFGSTESTNFCLGSSAPTCSDGIQNQGEAGIDCGGPCVACASCNDGVQNQGESGIDCGGPCSACPTCNDGIQNQGETGVDCGGPCSPCNNGGGCTDVLIDFSDFNSSWGIWNDGGSDCGRYNSSRAYSAPACARLRDNSSTSVMTTDQLNLAGFEEVTIDFTYMAVSMDNANEDFWLQVSLDNGAFFTVEEWNRGDEFENDQRKFDAVTLVGTFTSNTKFRFRCDASANPDYVYIDDVEITGCTNGARTGQHDIITQKIEAIDGVDDLVLDLNLYPNPTEGQFNIAYSAMDDVEAFLVISDIQGKTVFSENIKVKQGQQDLNIDSNNWSKGIYFVSIISEKQVATKKLVIK